MSFKKSRYLAVTFCLGALSIFSVASWGQAVPAEHADEARVDLLLKQMTLEEKMDLIRAGLRILLFIKGRRDICLVFLDCIYLRYAWPMGLRDC